MVMDGTFSRSCRPLNLPAPSISFSFLLIWLRRRGAKTSVEGFGGIFYVPLLFTSRERKNPRGVQGVKRIRESRLRASSMSSLFSTNGRRRHDKRTPHAQILPTV